ncbi:MAG: MSHA pilin protein MshD [Phenylobacterium sp.]|jgi:MSHA pilin protein MshD
MTVNRQQSRGFTLIEVVAGIVVMALALTSLVTFLNPQATRSTDPVLQVRAAELGQTLLNEILGKAFDENSNLAGGLLRCDEDVVVACTLSGGLGPEEASVNGYDDVDDYDGYNQDSFALAHASQYSSLYTGYTFVVTVFYDGNYDGIDDGNDDSHQAKLIRVGVTPPASDTIWFAAYKGNY